MPPITVAHPATCWSRLHDKFYHDIYDMGWGNIDLSHYEVVAAPLSGPIAVVRAEKRLQVATDPSADIPAIMIFTASGRLLCRINWDAVRIVKLGWTDDERLVCVCANGTVRLYTIFGESTQFTLGQRAVDEGILDGRIWGSGLVVLLANLQFVSVANLREPRPRLLADAGLPSLPHDWTAVSPEQSVSRNLELYVAVGSTVVTVDHLEAQDQLLSGGPFTRIVVSPNGKLVALFTSEGYVCVTSVDFQRRLSEFKTDSILPPKQFAWCGVDSVVLAVDSELVVVGPFGDSIRASYDVSGRSQLVTEIDGLRVITAEQNIFIQKVPQPLDDIFRIGSTAPGALLLDAFELFQQKNPKAQEHVRSLKSELPDAIDSCISAAGFAASSIWQRTLLKAASFGMSFIDAYNADTFVEMCNNLRVINAIAHHEIGIPLTLPQFLIAKSDSLVQRLVGRRHHLLALRVAEHLRLPIDNVLVDWACNKIKRLNLDDDAVARVILTKLLKYPGLSYAEVAKAAFRAGKTRLATLLIDHEPYPSDQVPLLLSMQQHEHALTKAIESSNTDLVYLVLFLLRQKLQLDEFFKLVNDKPIACNLLVCYAKEQDRSLLQDFYYQDDRRSSMAALCAQDAFLATESSDKLSKLQVALKYCDKSQTFDTKCLDEQCRLLQLQTQLEQETTRSFIGLSVSETLKQCILSGQASKATKMKADFKIPDRRFWWLKLKALAELRDWEELERFAKSKKSPIGYLPFVQQCIASPQYAEAAKYIERCDASIRPSLYVRIKWFDKASEQAFLNKDVEMLSAIRTLCDDPQLAREIDVRISQLAK